MTSSSVGFASALSTLSPTPEALREAIAAATDQLACQANLGVVFFSHHHKDRAEFIAANAAEMLGPSTNLMGCTGEAIAGPGCEIEKSPALAIWLAALPKARITTMRLEFRRTSDGHVIAGWPDELAAPWPDDSFLIALGEPYSFPADAVLEKLNQDRPGIPIVGGMASGAPIPGGNRLILGSQAYREGAVVVHVSGVRLRTIVSQGCRPIGKPFVVTKAERNVVYELGGRPALEQLRQIFQTLPTCEQQLVNRGLHLGRVVDEYRDHFEQGDFLVRNVIGGDANTGAIAVADYIRAGQTVQFHVRDADSADAELRQLLAAVRDQPASGPRSALLFTCNGRGTQLFSQAHHDAGAIREVLGDIPLAGFFAQGEMGPIGGKNFLHGFTASIAVLEGA
jgi:small ligand-binding sensory domain FIST